MKTLTTTARFAALLILLLAGPRTSDAQIVTVALYGDTAPGTSDIFVNFDRDSLVLNDVGQTAFRGYLRLTNPGIIWRDNLGIWSEGGGNGLALVAHKGRVAPDTSYNFNGFHSLVLNDAGQTAFHGSLRSGFGPHTLAYLGIWSEGGGSGLSLVARKEYVAPGTSDIFASFRSLVLNDGGQTAFIGHLKGGSITANLGIWSEGGGSGLALVAREGSMAPGTSDSFVSLSGLVLNDAGQTAFRGGLNSSIATNVGIWSEGGGSGLALLAREGSMAPGTSNNFSLLGNLALNNAGQTAFSGLLNSGSSATDGGIWSEGGGSGLALIAREGSVAPGTSNNFSRFGGLVLNDRGQTAFSGESSSGRGRPTRGIWSEGGGSGLALIAREGSVAPGTGGTFSYFTKLVLNDAGQTAFFGHLPSSTSALNGGIWAEDQAGVLTQIARTGDLLDVDDGPGTDFRTIKELSFSGYTGNSDGRPSGFNNLGQLAFWAEFTDGTKEIFVSNRVAIPEPSTLLLGAMSCMGMLMRRNR